MHLQKRVITYEDFNINANELLTMREAAEKLNIKLSGLRGIVDRGTLTEIVDKDAIDRNRRYSIRFVLRNEIEALAKQRQAEQVAT